MKTFTLLLGIFILTSSTTNPFFVNNYNSTIPNESNTEINIGRRSAEGGCTGGRGVCSFSKLKDSLNSSLLHPVSSENFKAKLSETNEGALKIQIHKASISVLTMQEQFKEGYFFQTDTLKLSEFSIDKLAFNNSPNIILPGYYPITETETSYELLFSHPLTEEQKDLQLESKKE